MTSSGTAIRMSKGAAKVSRKRVQPLSAADIVAIRAKARRETLQAVANRQATIARAAERERVAR